MVNFAAMSQAKGDEYLVLTWERTKEGPGRLQKPFIRERN